MISSTVATPIRKWVPELIVDIPRPFLSQVRKALFLFLLFVGFGLVCFFPFFFLLSFMILQGYLRDSSTLALKRYCGILTISQWGCRRTRGKDCVEIFRWSTTFECPNTPFLPISYIGRITDAVELIDCRSRLRVTFSFCFFFVFVFLFLFLSSSQQLICYYLGSSVSVTRQLPY